MSTLVEDDQKVDEILGEIESSNVVLFTDEREQTFLKVCVGLHIIGCMVVGRAIFLERK